MRYVRFRPRKHACAGTGGESSRCRSRRRGARASYIVLHLGAVADAWEERATEREGNVLEFALESKLARPRCQ